LESVLTRFKGIKKHDPCKGECNQQGKTAKETPFHQPGKGDNFHEKKAD
jgi:hypothetical protein